MISIANPEIVIILEDGVFGNQSNTSYKSNVISCNLTPVYNRETRRSINRDYDISANFNFRVVGTIVKTFKYTELDTYLLNNIINGNNSFKVYLQSDNRYYMVNGCKVNEFTIGIRKTEIITLQLEFSGTLEYAETPFTLDYSPIDETGGGITHMQCILPYKSTDLTFKLTRETDILFDNSQAGFDHINMSPCNVDVQDTRYIEGVDELADMFTNTLRTVNYTIGSKAWVISGYSQNIEPVIQPQLADTLRQVNFVNCKLTIT